MLTKLQTLREEREEGFTLIELLVVILIIGILSAIAIPAFLNQRKAAVDASIESDVSNAAKAVATTVIKSRTVIADKIVSDDSGSGTLGFISPMNLASGIAPMNASVVYPDLKVSSGNTIFVKPSQDVTEIGEYCIYGVAKGGDKYASTPVTYDSLAGGLHGTGGACGVTIPDDVAELVAGGGTVDAPVGGGEVDLGDWSSSQVILQEKNMDYNDINVTYEMRYVGKNKAEIRLNLQDVDTAVEQTFPTSNFYAQIQGQDASGEYVFANFSGASPVMGTSMTYILEADESQDISTWKNAFIYTLLKTNTKGEYVNQYDLNN